MSEFLYYRRDPAACKPLNEASFGKKAWTKKITTDTNGKPMLPASFAQKSVLILGLAVGLTNAAFANSFSPQGGEYSISGPSPGDQTAPSVAIAPIGGWVVWQDNGLARAGIGIAARRLDSNLNPLGNTIHVNRTAADNEKPQVSVLNDGGAAVVWQGGKLGFQNVYARFLKPDGGFAGNDILVSRAPGKQTTRITTNWMVMRNNKVRARTMRVSEIVAANVERTGGACIATLADGSVVVAYASGRKVVTSTPVLTERVRRIGRRYVTNSVLTSVTGSSDTMQDIYFQRFSATGDKLGSEVRANQFAPFNQRSPAIAARPDGSFVLVWTSELQGRANGDPSINAYMVSGKIPDTSLSHQMDIVARAFDANGEALGAEFVVNTDDNLCSNPSVAQLPGGGFTVAWTQKDQVRENSLDIYARSFGPDSVGLGSAFRVNGYTYGDQHTPRIASAPGGQLVVWTSLAQDGSREGVFGRWLSGGALADNEFRVNTTTLLRQFHPAVAADSGNRAVVIWSSYQTQAGFDLFGQRFIAQ